MNSASGWKLSNNLVETNARAMPSMTGIGLSVLRVLNLLPNITADSTMVKIEIAPRTT